MASQAAALASSSPWKFPPVPNNQPTPGQNGTVPSAPGGTLASPTPSNPEMMPGNFGLAELSSIMAVNPALANFYFGNIPRNFLGTNLLPPQIPGQGNNVGAMGQIPSPPTSMTTPNRSDSTSPANTNDKTNNIDTKSPGTTGNDALNLTCLDGNNQPQISTSTGNNNNSNSSSPLMNSSNDNLNLNAQSQAAAAVAAAAFYASQFRFFRFPGAPISQPSVLNNTPPPGPPALPPPPPQTLSSTAASVPANQTSPTYVQTKNSCPLPNSNHSPPVSRSSGFQSSSTPPSFSSPERKSIGDSGSSRSCPNTPPTPSSPISSSISTSPISDISNSATATNTNKSNTME